MAAKRQSPVAMPTPPASAPKLLAVTVTPEGPPPTHTERRSTATEHLEIGLPDGICIRVFGAVPSEQLERVLRLLRR